MVYNTEEEAVANSSVAYGGDYESVVICPKPISLRIPSGVLTHQNILLLKSLGLKLRGERKNSAVSASCVHHHGENLSNEQSHLFR